MPGLSNAQLAQQVSTLVDLWNQREREFRDWVGGTATGGPQGDGRYPLTNGLGTTSLVACPASLASTVAGPGASAAAAKLAAEAARDFALSYRDAADQSRVLAQAAQAAAVAARDLTLQYRDRAAAAEANSLVYKQAAEAAATALASARDTAVQAKTDAVAAKGAAEAARDLAQGYAAQAATFNPANFAAKVHTHAISDVTGLQTALDAKLATTGFTWAALSGKPTTFVPSAHTHVIADTTGLQAALDAKVNLSAVDVQATANAVVQRDASGNIYGNYLRTTSGLYNTAGMYWIPDGGTTPVRWSIQSGHATAAGFNLRTSDGVHRGAVYYDGSLGFLNQVNGWRFRTYSGGASIYTDGGVENKVWTNGNIPNDGWQTSVDGKGRFWFATNSDSIWKSAASHAWRNASDSTLMTLDGSTGGISMIGNIRAAATGGTGQFTAVSGNTFAGFYNDGSTFYVLKSATSNSAFDGHRPLYVSLSTGAVYLDGTGAGGTNVGGSLIVGGGLAVNGTGGISINGGELWMGSGHWIRMNGSEGLYWQQWGGGWYMNEAGWMRLYGDKNLVTGGTIQMGAFTVTSDRRLKSDIVPILDASAILDATRVYEFTKGGRRMYGMLAQEVREIAPILVSDSAHIHPEDGDPILAFDQTGYIPLLVCEVQSLRRRVAELEAA